MEKLLIKKLADSFRKTVSGYPDGKPPWVDAIGSAGGDSLFLPDSAVWQVHGSVATLIGGIRALLLQAAHPAALAGVLSHSRYESDLLGRLQGTSRWLTITTFGTTELIEKEARRVNEMHKRVSGEYLDNANKSSHYEARDPRFLLWVHCAFTESFLEAHRICRYPLTSADQYVDEWAASAVPLGLASAPRSEKELRAEIDRFMRDELRCDDSTRKVISFILNPPFGFFAQFFYKPLAKTAVISLTDAERNLLELKKPSQIWAVIARANLGLLKIALGGRSPAQELALKRIEMSGDERI